MFTPIYGRSMFAMSLLQNMTSTHILKNYASYTPVSYTHLCFEYDKDYYSQYGTYYVTSSLVEQAVVTAIPVSYTHLDVYKRQVMLLSLQQPDRRQHHCPVQRVRQPTS